MNWDKVKTMSNGCMEWVGARKQGTHPYGLAHHRGRLTLAHRAAYEERVGPIPEGATLDHLCKNPPCVNPAHLEPVTQAENLHRSELTVASINAAKTHCPANHPYDSLNTYRDGKGQRHCRTCRRAKAKARRAARRG